MGLAPSGRQGCHLVAEAGLFGVFEGRLNNLGALTDELAVSRSAGPGAVLIAAYRRWEEDFVRRLRGEYAFAIWDETRRRLVAGRDPFGVRPLHYAWSPAYLYVASNADQILSTGSVELVIDDRMVTEFLEGHPIARPRSFFRQVSRVPPGHILIATSQGTRTFEYRRWPQDEVAFTNRASCYEAFRELFLSAVRNALAADRPVVTELSGGADSDRHRMCRQSPAQTGTRSSAEKVVAASAVYPGMSCDESSYIDAVAKEIDIAVERWDATQVKGIEFEQPFVAGPGFRMPMASGTDGYVDIARAHEGSVIVSGLGGDQVGQPYGIGLDLLTRGRWREGVRHLFPRGTSARSKARRLIGTLAALSPRGWREALRPVIPRSQRLPAWLTPVGQDVATELRARRPVEGRFVSHGQRLRWRQLVDANIALSIDFKQRHALAFNLEARFPFFDWDLVTFALALPVEYWPDKRMHKEAFSRELPERLRNRRSKADFTPAVVNRVERQLSTISDLVYGSTWRAGRKGSSTSDRRVTSSTNFGAVL